MDEKYRYLNLQEQVGKNKHDIEELRTVKFNLERAGVRVVGEEASASDLPDPVTYTGQLGDAYLIGIEAPFDMYIYTQPSVGETNFKWFNIGAFPALGPQGEQGPEGPRGPQGDASNWRFGTVNPAILDTDREHDGYLNTTTGMVFEFSGTNWIPIGSIQGPRGNQGPIGPQGPTGRTGAQGNQGPQGPAGVTIEIIGVVDTVGSLPDPSTVSRNAGYILESGDDKNLYIIVEDENQDLTWYDAGAFAGVPGTAAGFGTISATVTPITPGTAPSVTVTTSGTNEAKNIAFAFSLPVGAELENTAASTPSETKGYTQKVIDQKTMDFVIKKPSDLGFTDGELPVSIFDVMQKITAQYTDMDIVIINESSNENIKDAPSTIGQLFIRTGKGGMTPLAMWVDNVYNVHLFYGTDSNIPANPVWYRIMTTKDAAGIGTPAGGTTGQLLAKRSDDDFDTVWEDVPNAPNGVPAGGSTGKILVKKSGTDYDTEWQTKPTGIPNGGTTGQIIKKQSGNDGDVAWSNAPVGLPAGGTTGQVLKKISDADHAANWANEAIGIPSGGTTGQVLQKTSGTDYAVEWATPAAGGGASLLKLSENLLINPYFNINQRGSSSWTSSTTGYMCDRWYKYSGGSISTSTPSTGQAYTMSVLQAKMGQFVIGPGNTNARFLFVIDANENNHTLSANPIYARYQDGLGSWHYMTPVDSGSKAQGGGGTSTHKQYYAVFSPESFAQLLEFGVDLTSEDQGANAVGFTKAGVYMIYAWDNDIKDLIFGTNGKGISVALPDFGEERNKCLYYFENIQQTNNRLFVMITSGTVNASGNMTAATFSVQVPYSEKRINPTITARPTIQYKTFAEGVATNISIATTTLSDYYEIGKRYANGSKSITAASGSSIIQGGIYAGANMNADAEIYP